jgi:hypothetical protein
MATFKTSYTTNPLSAKASITYIVSRPNRQGRAQSRVLFGIDGEVSLEQARRMVTEVRTGTTFYRFILSPDPKREDTRRDIRLSQVATATILDLEERLGHQIPFVGAIHDDHSPYRHVHLIALAQGRLTPLDLAAIRASATAASLLERQLADRTRERPPRTLFRPRHLRSWQPYPARRTEALGNRRTRKVGGKPWRPPVLSTCPRCRLFQSPSLAASSVTICAYCGLHLYRGRRRSQEVAWAL